LNPHGSPRHHLNVVPCSPLVPLNARNLTHVRVSGIRPFRRYPRIPFDILWSARNVEELEVDWAGDTMSYVDTSTGEIITAYLFVAVLPASSYPFAYAYEDMKMPSWIDAHVRTFEYMGGVPKVIIPDNTKTAVIKSDRIDPILNKSYYEMASHYRTTIVPARAGKPKDKASDENKVGHLSRRIIAALRNRQFFSLYEINQAIAEELVKVIHRPFQKMEGNRLTTLEQKINLVCNPCIL